MEGPPVAALPALDEVKQGSAPSNEHGASGTRGDQQDADQQQQAAADAAVGDNEQGEQQGHEGDQQDDDQQQQAAADANDDKADRAPPAAASAAPQPPSPSSVPSPTTPPSSSDAGAGAAGAGAAGAAAAAAAAPPPPPATPGFVAGLMGVLESSMRTQDQLRAACLELERRLGTIETARVREARERQAKLEAEAEERRKHENRAAAIMRSRSKTGRGSPAGGERDADLRGGGKSADMYPVGGIASSEDVEALVRKVDDLSADVADMVEREEAREVKAAKAREADANTLDKALAEVKAAQARDSSTVSKHVHKLMAQLAQEESNIHKLRKRLDQRDEKEKEAEAAAAVERLTRRCFRGWAEEVTRVQRKATAARVQTAEETVARLGQEVARSLASMRGELGGMAEAERVLGLEQEITVLKEITRQQAGLLDVVANHRNVAREQALAMRKVCDSLVKAVGSICASSSSSSSSSSSPRADQDFISFGAAATRRRSGGDDSPAGAGSSPSENALVAADGGEHARPAAAVAGADGRMVSAASPAAGAASPAAPAAPSPAARPSPTTGSSSSSPQGWDQLLLALPGISRAAKPKADVDVLVPLVLKVEALQQAYQNLRRSLGGRSGPGASKRGGAASNGGNQQDHRGASSDEHHHTVDHGKGTADIASADHRGAGVGSGGVGGAASSLASRRMSRGTRSNKNRGGGRATSRVPSSAGKNLRTRGETDRCAPADTTASLADDIGGNGSSPALGLQQWAGGFFPASPGYSQQSSSSSGAASMVVAASGAVAASSVLGGTSGGTTVAGTDRAPFLQIGPGQNHAFAQKAAPPAAGEILASASPDTTFQVVMDPSDLGHGATPRLKALAPPPQHRQEDASALELPVVGVGTITPHGAVKGSPPEQFAKPNTALATQAQEAVARGGVGHAVVGDQWPSASEKEWASPFLAQSTKSAQVQSALASRVAADQPQIQGGRKPIDAAVETKDGAK